MHGERVEFNGNDWIGLLTAQSAQQGNGVRNVAVPEAGAPMLTADYTDGRK